MKNNNKGFIGDIPTILLSCFIVVLGIVIMVFILNSINSDFNNNSLIPNEGKEIINVGSTQYPKYMDTFGIIMLLGLPLVAGGLAYFLDIASVFFWIFIIVSFVFILFGAVLSIFWSSIIENFSFSMVASNLVKINWVMNNYALYALFVVLCVSAGLFFRARRGI